ASLLAGGVEITKALQHGAAAAGDPAVTQRLNAARGQLLTGERLSSALGREGAATKSTIQLVQAGESSGDLAGLLSHAARIDSQYAQERLRFLARALEPALILVFAVVIAMIAAALLQAIYAVRPTP
ncbi:MAG: type II secretion system F family protein, partial [Gemmatimonadales bacterium]